MWLLVFTLAYVFNIIRPIIFSAVKNVFHNQENFVDQGIFHSQQNFTQVRKVFQFLFPLSSNFSTNTEFLHNQRLLHSPRSKNFWFSIKGKILDPFNTKFYAKNIFNPLTLVGDKRSYILTRTISFLSTCNLLLLSAKKLILYNILRKHTPVQTY